MSGIRWDVFYVVTTADGARVKFGVTTHDGNSRLSTHRADGYNRVVRVMYDLAGNDAARIEGAVLDALQTAAIGPVRGREYYSAQALPIALEVADNFPVSVQKPREKRWAARAQLTLTPEMKQALDMARVIDGIPDTARIRAMISLWQEDGRLSKKVLERARELR